MSGLMRHRVEITGYVRRVFATVLLITAIAQGSASHAQEDGLPYRSDAPSVVDAPGLLQDMSVETISRFSQAYSGRGEPRIALYWNRPLSAEVATGWMSVLTENEATVERSRGLEETSRFTEFGGSEAVKLAEEERESSRRFESRRAEQAAGDALRPGMAEHQAWRFESAFSQLLLQAGTRLIDRSTMIRMSAEGRSAKRRPNIRAIEGAALAEKADLLMEILLTPAQGTPAGFRFKVSVKDLQTGEIVATFVSDAMPRVERQRFIATSNGFERAVPEIGVDEVAQALALETMVWLAGVWNG